VYWVYSYSNNISTGTDTETGTQISIWMDRMIFGIKTPKPSLTSRNTGSKDQSKVQEDRKLYTDSTG